MFNNKSLYDAEGVESWNMNKAFLMRLDRRLEDRDKVKGERELLLWYSYLRSIYTNIHYKIIEKHKQKTTIDNEEKTIEDKHKLIINKFNEAKKTLQALGTANNNQLGRQLVALTLTSADVVLDEIDLLINDIIFEIGLIQLQFGKDWKSQIKEDYE